jgi:transposase-like protein
MVCPHCASSASTECPNRTELGYRRFRSRACQREFNEERERLLTVCNIRRMWSVSWSSGTSATS